jgi:tetratricopeptide (TPR) repeat protein
LDQRENARREFEHLAAGDFSTIDRDMFWVCTVYFLAEVCSYLGDVEPAQRLYDLLLPYAKRHVVSGFCCVSFGSVSRVLGLLATSLGRFEDAERHLETAIERDFRIGAIPWVVRALHGQARMLLARGAPGDRDRAGAAVDRALESALALGLEAMIPALRSLRGEVRAANGFGP